VLVETREDAGPFVLLHLEERSRESGLESPFLKEPSVRLGTRSNVLLIMNPWDSCQALKRSHDEKI
jgi:hypothetical protein